MALVIGGITTAQTVIGELQHIVPAFSDYLTTTGFPMALAIIDWINARIKEYSGKGLNQISLSDVQDTLTSLSSLKQQVQDAIAKLPKVN
jgi:hypothetical protein